MQPQVVEALAGCDVLTVGQQEMRSKRTRGSSRHMTQLASTSAAAGAGCLLLAVTSFAAAEPAPGVGTAASATSELDLSAGGAGALQAVVSAKGLVRGWLFGSSGVLAHRLGTRSDTSSCTSRHHLTEMIDSFYEHVAFLICNAQQQLTNTREHGADLTPTLRRSSSKEAAGVAEAVERPPAACGGFEAAADTPAGPGAPAACAPGSSCR